MGPPQKVIFCGKDVLAWHGTEVTVCPDILYQGALLRGMLGRDPVKGFTPEGVMYSRSLEGAFHFAPFVDVNLSDHGFHDYAYPQFV